MTLPPLVHTILAILFPPRKTEALLRATSLHAYEELVHSRNIEGVDALLPYSDKRVSALIWELKYKDSALAAKIAGKILAEHLVDILAEEMVNTALLVPVPLHKARARTRGYNQSERIAEQVLPTLKNVALVKDALTRVRDTLRQTTLGRAMRLRNIAGAFEANNTIVAGKTILLLDDVVTTGATLAEAKKTLLKAGAVKVIALALTYA